MSFVMNRFRVEFHGLLAKEWIVGVGLTEEWTDKIVKMGIT